ncbi:MAG: VOC family protein [Burkholderiaceae bacterium]
MANKQGDFIWYELMTGDADAAQQFYGKILGWKFQDSGQAGMEYRMFSAGDEGVGGFMVLTDEMTRNGARPCWLGYIAVDDVDASAKSISDAGGAVHMKPWDIPNVGRIAFVADAQGAMFYIMRPIPPAGNPDATSQAFAATEPKVGHCAWNELATSDPDAAAGFYSKQFGWEGNGDMDMGEMGKYTFWKVGDERGFMHAGMMAKPVEMPVSAWTYYFRVPNIDEAVRTIQANGGKTLHDPTEIPGGEFVVNGVDPQGAYFALVGKRF